MRVHVLALLPWGDTLRECVLIQHQNIFRSWFFKWEPRYRCYPRAILYARPDCGFTESTMIDTLRWGPVYATYHMAFDPRATDLHRAVLQASLSNPYPDDWWTIPAREPVAPVKTK